MVDTLLLVWYTLPMRTNQYWRDLGFLFPFTRYLLNFSHNWFTVIGWIENRNKELKPNRLFIDVYNLCWLAITLIIFFLYVILGRDIPICLKCFFVFVVLLRLIDTIPSAIRLSFFRSEPSEYPARSLILMAINYTEIIFIFSILYFFFNHTFTTILDSLNFSFHVFIPTLTKHEPKGTYWLFVLEIMVSLAIHLTILQRVLSYFKKD
jgi:hypothetical protein